MEDEEVRVPLRQNPRSEAIKKKARKTNRKYAALVIVGVLTCVYSIGEVGFALYVDSMALLSDGVHNASDVISLIIAFWALYKSSNENKSVSMTYGWRRAEILGAVMNGCFLISLCVYIVLEAIPKIIKNPTPLDSSWYFIGISASGFVINTIGTILFSLISGGHGHVHAGGGDHGHSHGHKEKKDKHEEVGHGHSHGQKKKESGHEEGHGHAHGQKKKEKDHEEGHGHAHGQKKKEKSDHEEGHGHGHGEKKEKKEKKDHEEGHGHGHGEKKKEKKDHEEGHGHGHGKKKEKYGHDEEKGHGHGHGKKKEKDSDTSDEQEKEEKGDQRHSNINSQGDVQVTWNEEDGYPSHDCSDEEEYEMKEPEDHNMRAVFLHYLGDALSSLLVLAAGLLSKYFPGQQWTLYLDPGCSLLIVLLILWTTIPLIYECSKILLQKAPSHINIPSLKEKLLNIPGVRGIHDLHVWELIDSLYIASAHVLVQDNIEAKTILNKMKTVMHKNGIHSSTLQVEFLENSKDNSCKQFCVEECPEDWCCKDIALEDYQ
eukprot:TRINITY_DN2896_c1_g1_i2.p1 TRINITY_DN2896_c1_g1~~TRINITY_DN2896_c1_g1_i2.p1  ORF type:complete len:575 (-),score=125.92 TRINITY_DN2896_c1_g1_i2:54-1682(-)